MLKDAPRELERRARADPEDRGSRTRWIYERFRRERLEAVLEPLRDRNLWSGASGVEQTEAIEAVALVLGENFRFVETRVFPRFGGLAQRIASFGHRQTGMRLQLLPGQASPDPRQALAPFLLGRSSVLQEEWRKVDDENPSYFQAGADAGACPVERVSWDMARAWIKRLDDPRFCLPSAAQLEYAHRAGSTSAYFWGEALDGNFCWHEGNSGYRTHPFWEHIAWTNAFGLIDMSGNVWDWCRDLLQPFEIPYRDLRALHGGSWHRGGDRLSSGASMFKCSDYRSVDVGFRLCLQL